MTAAGKPCEQAPRAPDDVRPGGDGSAAFENRGTDARHVESPGPGPAPSPAYAPGSPNPWSATSPASALDVLAQARIPRLMKDHQREKSRGAREETI